MSRGLRRRPLIRTCSAELPRANAARGGGMRGRRVGAPKPAFPPSPSPGALASKAPMSFVTAPTSMGRRRLRAAPHSSRSRRDLYRGCASESKILIVFALSEPLGSDRAHDAAEENLRRQGQDSLRRVPSLAPSSNILKTTPPPSTPPEKGRPRGQGRHQQPDLRVS